jgi:hypothetical protein
LSVRVHAEEPAFIVIEINEVKTHFALAGRGDFDQPAAQGETFERAAEHDTANKIKDDIRAFSTGRRANFRRKVVRADDQLLRYGANRRVLNRRSPVRSDHAAAEASSDLGGGAADTASGADQQHGLR